MTGSLMGIIISFLIGAVAMLAPRDKNERKIAALPTMEQKADGHNLRGWTYEKLVSPSTNVTHYYYSFPSKKPGAPTLVMLHGFNTDGRTFGTLTPLAERYNLIAYNFPEESMLYKGRMTDFVGILDDFCITLNLDSVCLCGNSVGGAIASCFAANSTQTKVSRILFVSSQAFGATEADRARGKAMAARLLPYEDYRLFALLDKSRSLLRRLERVGFGEDSPQEILVLRRIGWYRQILSSLRDYDGTRDLARITCPVIAFHGAKDRVIPLENARMIQKLVPGAYFEVIPNRGHAMVFNDGEEVAKKLLTMCPAGGVKSEQ